MANAFQRLEARRQGKSIGLTGFGERIPKRGPSSSQAFPAKWLPGLCVKMPTREGEAVCSQA